MFQVHPKQSLLVREILVRTKLSTPVRWASTENSDSGQGDTSGRGSVGSSATDPSSNCGAFSQLFTVTKKDRDRCPIINLKHLNTFLDVKHFKTEGINIFKDVVQEKGLDGKLDLLDAYFMVLIHLDDRKYLLERTIQESPLWISNSSWYLYKCLWHVLSSLRRMGIRLVVYLDNIQILLQSAEALKTHMHLVAQRLESLGFKLNGNVDGNQCS